MENKKTTELMSRKSTLKSKLMAAVSMLLVSAIMVSVTTYAWFILSTAPEVKGMSTTVGSNGALEMALLNKETGANMDMIKAGVGDSIATSGNVTASNITWGNLVDLEDTSYGLDQITLYPAQLSSLTGLSRTASALSYAVYGTDGRVANLDGMTESGVRDDTGKFVADTTSYGVRAIGRANSADPMKKNFADAVNAYTTHGTNAVNYAKNAFGDNLMALLNIATTRVGEDAANYKYTKETVTVLKVLGELKNAVSEMQLAVKSAIAAKINSEATAESQQVTMINIEKIDLTNYASDAIYRDIIADLTALEGKINTQIAAATALQTEGAANGWTQFRPIYNALMGLDGSEGDPSNTQMLFDPKDEAGESIARQDGAAWTFDKASGLMNIQGQIVTLDVKIRYGMFKDMADITGQMSKDIDYSGKKGVATVVAKNSIDKTAIDTAVAGYHEPAGNGGTAKSYIEDYYGYAVDLAFRTNADSNKLKLATDRMSRVSGSDEQAVQGGGSTFTFKDKVDDAVKKALRVAFVNAEGSVLGIAKLDANPVAGNNLKYALHMYSAESLENGVLKLSETTTDEIMTLNSGVATRLTAIVYMDGTYLDNTVAAGASGKLNLQFCGSETLQSMGYSGYNSGVELSKTPSTVAAGAATEEITATFNKATLGENQSFSWKSSAPEVADVQATGTDTTKNTAKIQGKTAGTATITVSFGKYSKSFTIQVTGQAAP